MPDVLLTARRLRQFSRFYTRQFGLLNPGLLHSALSLADVRILYELAHRDAPTATEIAATLRMDEGYLSRLLRRLRQRGLVRAQTASADRRQRQLSLTAKGRRIFASLDRAATEEAAELIAPLNAAERGQLLAAVTTVESLLDGRERSTSSAAHDEVTIGEAEPGDLGWVIQRHGELYWNEYGWNAEFERLVARIVADFADQPTGRTRRAWIARLNGRRAGCVFLVPDTAEHVGRLRLLLVEPWARGHKLGTTLVGTCIEAARAARCTRLTLWTNDVLVAARRIYEHFGFTLTRSERHTSYGKRLVAQDWDLLL